MSEEKEPTLIIKSEDLQDPKLYNFILVANSFTDSITYPLRFAQLSKA